MAKVYKRKRFDAVDVLVVTLLTLWMLLIIIPFVNAIAISFATQKEYVDNPLMLFPSEPTLKSYELLFNDYRIWTGFRTSFLIVLIGVPANMLLTTVLAYGTSRGDYPGKKIIIGGILFAMLFNGGIIPLYLQMKEFHLTNTLWSVVLAGTVNVFYFVIMRNYFQSLPESLIESARLDGAGEWRVLGHIILPLSKPIIATLTLFYLVDRWNEWYNALIFIRDTEMQPLQLVLRSIVMESNIVNNVTSAAAMEQMQNFDMGVKMAAVIVTILPVMCVYPFLQKHFAQGVMVGAVKA
ncbi:MAG: carbohydrate ABC transporter permease [Eubacteriales bacterium]